MDITIKRRQILGVSIGTAEVKMRKSGDGRFEIGEDRSGRPAAQDDLDGASRLARERAQHLE